MTLPVYTEDQAVQQLIRDYFGGYTYGWALGADRALTYSIAAAVSAAERALIETALDAWAEVAGLSFVPIESGGQIAFQNSAAGAYTAMRGTGVNMVSATVNVSSSWFTTYGGTLGSYSYQTYVHEIGHALGLGHTGNYNGSASFASDALYANDSWQTSIMSYFSQTENPNTGSSYAYLLTPMAFDVAAMRALYGPPAAVHGGDTTYGSGSTAGAGLDYLGTANHRTTVAFTLLDSDGLDTLDVSARPEAARIDLTPGAISDLFGQRGNMVIQAGTVIEDLRSGAGADRITGNAAANRIAAGAGNDTIFGGSGDDTLSGEAGDDRLSGEAGDDLLTGGAGADVFGFGPGFSNDTVSDLVTSLDVIDLSAITAIPDWIALLALMADSAAGVRIATSEGTILLAGVAISMLDPAYFLLAGDRGLVLAGTVDRDRLQGGPGADTIDGGAGNDRLVGGAGNDSITGGAGRDIIAADAGDDRVSGGADDDRIDLGAGNDIFLDSTDPGADTVLGGLGADVLTSLGGRDSFDGGAGEDALTASGAGSVLQGGLGNDTLTGGAGSDSVTDTGGNDLVSLGAGPDSYTASGDSAANADTIAGGDGNDMLAAGAGNDSLDGGAGNDRLAGNAGHDTLLGGAGADRITAGDGDDRVEGGTEGDRIDLGAGNDIFIDGADAGNDTVLGGLGNDVLTSLGGIDNLEGGPGDDSLTASDLGGHLAGGLGNDTLTGGAGIDSVTDIGGNDLISLGAGNDLFIASGDDAGTADTILAGAGNDRLSAGAGNDLILAGPGDDRISAGAGDDTITAGAGADLMTGGLGRDVFVFAATDGSDRITDFRVGVDDIDLRAIDGLTIFADLSGHMTQSGRAVVIVIDDLSLTLTNVVLSSLTETDFLL